MREPLLSRELEEKVKLILLPSICVAAKKAYLTDSYDYIQTEWRLNHDRSIRLALCKLDSSRDTMYKEGGIYLENESVDS